jgi:hypothetical protein
LVTPGQPGSEVSADVNVREENDPEKALKNEAKDGEEEDEFQKE